MKSRYKLLIPFIMSFFVLPLQAQVSGELTENITDEADVRSGGRTIIITIHGTTFENTLGNNSSVTAEFYAGMSGSTAWEEVKSTLATDAVVVTDDTIATISLPPVPDYFITQDDTIAFLVPATCLASGADLALGDSIAVTNNATSLAFGGTIRASVSEDNLRTAAYTYTLELLGNMWRADIREDSVLNYIKGMFSGAPVFAANVSALTVDDLSLNLDSTLLTISFPADPSYYISSSETVVITPAENLLRYPESITGGGDSFSISNTSPLISFPNTTFTENAIRNGANSLTITLTGDEWADPVASNLKDAFSGDTSWSNQIKDNLVFLLLDPHTLQMTIPQLPTYNIAVSAAITLTVTGSHLLHSSGTFAATGTLTLEPAAASLAVSGTLSGSISEGTIRSTTHYLTLKLTEEEWPSDLETNGSLRETLITGISSTGPGWTVLESAILGGNQGDSRVHLNGSEVTIDIPAVSSFDITAAETLSVTVDGSLLDHTPGGLGSSSFCTLTPLAASMQIYTDQSPLNESNLNGSVLSVKLHEDTFVDGTFSVSNFVFTPDFSGKLRIQTAGDIDYFAPDSLRITLFFNGDFDTDTYISLFINGSELTNTSAGLTSSNQLLAVASIEPTIDTVYFANSPMGIDDVVNVTIKLAESDEGNTFTLNSGTVAGRTLTGLGRDDEFTYHASFTVLEFSAEYTAGQDIPIDNVQLFNGLVPGNIFSTLSTNNNDPIDTHRPVVDLISVNGGSYHIGQTVPVVLHADGINYSIREDQTFVNTVPASSPSVSWTELGSGVYQLNYLVSDGDPDVTGAFPVEVVMNDLAGNISNPFTSVTGTAPLVDASIPEIDSMVVETTGLRKVGDDVRVLVYTSEAGLLAQPGTMINNVPLSATRVTFAPTADDTIYALTYVIASGDASVLPGDLECTVSLKDAAGNEASQINNLKNNTVEINTLLPTATIVGDGEICSGDSTRIYVNMTGSGPFDLVLNRNGSGFITVNDVSSPYSLYVKPTTDASYTVASVTDNIGNTATGSGSVTVVVHQLTPVEITNTRNTYVSSEGRVLLTANYSPGIFTGDGVETSSGYFYPAWIEPDGSWHSILYSYTDAYGCKSEATKDFAVLKDAAQVTVDSIICFNQGPTEIVAENVENDIGSFELFNASWVQQPTGLVDTNPFDNRAQIVPDDLKGGIYYVRYNYKYGGDDIDLDKQIFIDRLLPMEIIEGPADSICHKDPQYELRGNLDNISSEAQHRFYGDGVSGNMLLGFYYIPENAALGTNRITYKYTSENGCSDSIYTDVVNRFVPDLSFTLSTTCIPSDGGEVAFTNLTDQPDSVLTWSWTFGDSNSGEFNFSDELAPVHDYTGPGNRKIELDVTTTMGCITGIDSIVEFGDRPLAEFNWVSDCYLEDAPVVFENNSFSELSWQQMKWTFFDKQGTEIGSASKTTADTVHFAFPEMEDYRVKLVASNIISTGQTCSDSVEQEIVLKPTISLADTSYFETFNDDFGRWSTKASTSSNSWTYSEPDFTGLDPDQGNLAWFTSFPVKSGIEESWVASPCFDLRFMERPMIRMNILRSFDQNRDGAVIEYSENDGRDWTRLGDYNEGINWYNSYDIINKPDNNSIGWSGSSMEAPDSVWIEASHDLDSIKGKTSVIFRVIYATDGGSVSDNQGFAFDNVYIGERSKKVLLEHFTSSADNSSMIADNLVDNMAAAYPLDVLDIQYHMAYPGEDPMNLNNPAPAASRSFYYGINSVPYMVMDGGYAENTRYDFASLSPQAATLQKLALEMPKFDLDLLVKKEVSYLHVRARVTAREPVVTDGLLLNLAVVEKEITGYTGDNNDVLFRNVVLAMLPGPAGTLLEEDWDEGTEIEKTFNWTYSNVEDLDDLMVVAFIQDYETMRIYQAVAEDGSGSTSVPDAAVAETAIRIFPNPADHTLYVDPGFITEQDVLLRVTDITGKQVLIREFAPGQENFLLEVKDLEQGIYILTVEQDDVIRGRERFIKVR